MNNEHNDCEICGVGKKIEGYIICQSCFNRQEAIDNQEILSDYEKLSDIALMFVKILRIQKVER